MSEKIRITFLFDKRNDYKKKYFDIFKNNKKYIFKKIYDYKNLKKCDVLFLISFTKILPLKYFRKVNLTLVIHESNLPSGRGCSPVMWEILKNKKLFYISILELKEKVDTGRILLKDKFYINHTDLYDEIRDKQSQSNIKIVKKFLKIYPKIKFKPQTGTPTYFRHRSIRDSKLNINKTIKSQFNLMRINNNKSWPSFFYINGKKFFLKIYKDKD